MKVLLVDDEERVLKGVSRVLSCEREDWDVETSLSGAEALEILSEESFDVVVSDMRMPGMDGAELLQTVGQRYPSTIRIVLSGQADRETVLQAVRPMHQYLSKPCDPKELIRVIGRAAIFQETIGSSEVLDAIGRANCMPAFPEIVNEINRVIEADGKPEAIAELVAMDPVLCARILQLANSSIFALRTPVADVARAVSLVGLDMVRSLALQQAVYSEQGNNNATLSPRALLSHGFEVAMIGRCLAKEEGCSRFDADVIFSAGLLHDVGKLMLLNALPEKYESVLNCDLSSGETVSDKEMQTFGATHQGISAYLFSIWGLPEEVIDAVAAHHSFEACALAEGKPRQFVFAANWIANNANDDGLAQLAEQCEHQPAGLEFASTIRRWRKLIAERDQESVDV